MKNLFFCIVFIISSFFIPLHGRDTGNKEKIIIKGYSSNIPYEFLENDNPSGFTIDLVKLIMQDLDLPYEISLYDAETAITEFQNITDYNNLLLNKRYSSSLTKDFFVTTPFCEIKLDVICHNDCVYTGIEDLEGKIIAIREGAETIDDLRNLNKRYVENIVQVKNSLEALRMVENGTADYAICNSQISRALIIRNRIPNLNIYNSEIPPFGLCFVSKNRDLIRRINKSLFDLNSSGVYDTIYYKWFGDKEEKNISGIILYIIGLLLLLAAITTLIAVVFRHKVRKAVSEINNANGLILDLNRSINFLIGKSSVSIFISDLKNKSLYKYEKGNFSKTKYTFEKIVEHIHPDDKSLFDNCFKDLIEKKIDKVEFSIRIYSYEYNKYLDFAITATIQYDAQGNDPKTLFSLIDETRQKELIRNKSQVIESLDLALKSAKLILWEYDLKNNENIFKTENSLSYNVSDSEILEMLHHDDVKEFLHFIDNVKNRQQITNVIIVRLKLLNSDKYKPYEITALLKSDEENNSLSVFGILRDVSEIFDYQSRLNEKIKQLETIKDNLPYGIAYFDKNENLCEINEFLINFLKDENKASFIREYNKSRIFKVSARKAARLRNGNVISIKLNSKNIAREIKELCNEKLNDDRIFNLSIAAVFDYDNIPAGYMMLIEDITERERYNQKIEILQNNLNLAFEAGEISAWKYDVDLQKLSMLRGVALSPNITEIREFSNFIHPEDIGFVVNEINSIRNKSKKKTNICFRLRNKNKWDWYLSHIIGVRKNEKVVQLIGTLKDVTKDIKTKEMLKKINFQLLESNLEIIKSEERLKMILDKLPFPIFIKDETGAIINYANEEAYRVFGEKDHERETPVLISEEDQKQQQQINSQVLETGEEYVANEVLTLKNGKVLDTFVKKTRIEHKGKKQILIVRIDTTEQQMAQLTTKILSASLPSLKAYIWYIDKRNNILKYIKSYVNAERDLFAINSIEKLISFMHVEDREQYRRSIDDIMEKESGEKVIFYRIDLEKQGKYEWWETRAVVETIESNDISYKYLYGINININEQKSNEIKLERSRQRLDSLYRENELILNNVTSILVYMNKEYEVQWTNSANIFDGIYKDRFVKGKKCYVLCGNSRPCDRCPVEKAIETKEIVKSDYFPINKEVFEITAIPVTGIDGSGYVEGIVLKLDNITERMKLIDDLRLAKKKTEESDRLKMAFLANMSHEIRTPLNAIVGFSEMLQYSETKEERDEFMKLINSNSELLLRLIGDILDLSKIESGTIEIRKDNFDIVDVFRDLYTTFTNRCTNPDVKLISVSSMEKCIVMLDKNRFVQVVVNFITNAMKYTLKGEIIMSLEMIDGGIKISVKDTGIGISADKQHLVFERFEKLDSFAQGTGLGLAITKAIMEALQGKIGFESTEGVGSTFWAWFPCHDSVKVNDEFYNLSDIEENLKIKTSKVCG